MRNLKRVLALALALVMVIGMMVMGASAASYTDAADISAEYVEAIDVMTGVGMYEGEDDGSFLPKEVLTRKHAAALLARLTLGEKTADKLIATKQIFSDVAVSAWYAPYVEYCYQAGLIDGLGDGTFAPDAPLTGIAFAKLILVAMGYDADAAGYVGKDWASNISVDALTNGLTVDGVVLADEVTREVSAQMLFQALEKNTVSYTTAFDKATGAPVLVYKGKNLDETFASKYFPLLKKVTGVVSDTDLYWGLTTVDGVDLYGTDADWTSVGYAARAWYLKGSYNTALSIVVTGKDLAVSTDGTPLTGSYSLTNYARTNPYYAASLDAKVIYVENGEVVTAADITPAVGTKIALVDNNKNGYADAVVATEYTAAKVTGVLKTSATGTIADYTYYTENLTTNKADSIDAEDLANVAGLAKDSYITYVVVDGYYYVTDTTTTTGKFESMTRATVGASSVMAYGVAGESYVASERTVDTNVTTALTGTNLTEKVVVVTDEYGYIIFAKVYTDPAAYLLVMSNEDTHGIKNLAETSVAYSDGSIAEILTAWNTDIADDDLAIRDVALGGNSYNAGGDGEYGVMYTYETNKAGNIELKPVNDYYKKATYVEKSIAFDGVNLTPFTTFVDLRDVIKGKATSGTVYTGYMALPGITEAEIVYTTKTVGDNTVMDLAYIIGGTNTADLKASFVVFNTNVNVQTAVKAGKLVHTYTLTAGVLVRGNVIPNYELTEEQYKEIAKYGAGVYNFGVDGKLASEKGFTPFTDDTIQWTPENSGTLIDIVDEIALDVTDEYTPVFVNLAKGTVNYWYQFVQAGDYYCYLDKSIPTDKIVYIVTDGTVSVTDLAAAKAAAIADLKAYVKFIVDNDLINNQLTAADVQTVVDAEIVKINAATTVAAVEAYANGQTGSSIIAVYNAFSAKATELTTGVTTKPAAKAQAVVADDDTLAVVFQATATLSEKAAAIEAAMTAAGYTNVVIANDLSKVTADMGAIVGEELTIVDYGTGTYTRSDGAYNATRNAISVGLLYGATNTSSNEIAYKVAAEELTIALFSGTTKLAEAVRVAEIPATDDYVSCTFYGDSTHDASSWNEHNFTVSADLKPTHFKVYFYGMEIAGGNILLTDAQWTAFVANHNHSCDNVGCVGYVAP